MKTKIRLAIGFLVVGHRKTFSASLSRSVSLPRRKAMMPEQPFLCDVLDTLLPAGGILMAIQVFSDESGTHDSSNVITMAGYAFEHPAQAGKFSEEWQQVLDEFGIEYFRMSECAHRTGQFDGKSADACDRAARLMIGIIKRRANIGLAYSILRSDFDSVFNSAANHSYGGIYTLCTQMILHGVAQWANERDYHGEVAYFFEAGHPSQSEANHYLNLIASDEYHSSHGRAYRYGSHSFGLKKKILPLQAGDILAWHWRLQRERELKGRRSRRLDFVSLCGLPTLAVHAQRENLIALLKETAAFQANVLKCIGHPPDAIERFINARLATPDQDPNGTHFS